MNGIPITVLGIDEVKEWEGNARIHTKRNLDELKKSIQRWGQYKPIIVQKSSMRIIAGNGTYQAIVALGLKEVNCNIIDVDDTEAEAMMIADNRTGLLSQWDDKILTGSLKHLQEEGKLNLTGYDSVELDKMLSFQDGGMFEKVEPKKDEPKKEIPPKKEETPKQTQSEEFDTPPSGEKEESASYSQQISFTLDGFTFTLSNPQLIKELHELMQYLKDSKKNEREEVNDIVFEKIMDALVDKFLKFPETEIS